MREPRLRVYFGPEDDEKVTSLDTVETTQPTISVPLGEVFLLLADAVRKDLSWLRDFEDDEVTISTDLYEVILAYQHYRRPTG